MYKMKYLFSFHQSSLFGVDTYAKAKLLCFFRSLKSCLIRQRGNH